MRKSGDLAGISPGISPWICLDDHYLANDWKTLIARMAAMLEPLQADGDYLGDVELARYSVLPDALHVVA